MTNFFEVIYIHPQTPMFEPLTIPLSLPALIKRLDVKVKGYHYNEVSDEIIKNSKIVIVDIHWFLSLKGAIELASRIKLVNQKAILIAGGVTATIYSKWLVEKGGFDYIIKGDAEVPLTLLVNEILLNNIPTSVPNLVGKNGFSTKQSYFLTSEDLNNNEFYDIDFFPTLQKRVSHLHNINKGWPPQLFPYLIPFRGCPIKCEVCLGGEEEQLKVFKRKSIIRSSKKLAEDLDYLDNSPIYSFVSMLHDFVTLLPDVYNKEILNKRRELFIGFEFASMPAIVQLERLMNSFKGGVLYFSIDNHHLTSTNLNDANKMIELLLFAKKNKAYTSILNYNKIYAQRNDAYKKNLVYIYNKTKVLLYDASFWWTEFPRPDIEGNANENEIYKFINNKNDNYIKHLSSNLMAKMINNVDEYSNERISLNLRKTYFRTIEYLKYKTL